MTQIPSEAKIVEAMAQVMQKQFPVVVNGIGDNGDWGSNPLEIEIFKRSSKLALQAMLKLLPEPIDGYQNRHDAYYRALMKMRNER